MKKFLLYFAVMSLVSGYAFADLPRPLINADGQIMHPRQVNALFEPGNTPGLGACQVTVRGRGIVKITISAEEKQGDSTFVQSVILQQGEPVRAVWTKKLGDSTKKVIEDGPLVIRQQCRVGSLLASEKFLKLPEDLRWRILNYIRPPGEREEQPVPDGQDRTITRSSP